MRNYFANSGKVLPFLC